jgi:hypothetical protein
MAELAQTLLLLARPFLHAALGLGILRGLARATRAPEAEPAGGGANALAALFALGLLAHLAAAFALRLVGLPWWIASLLPLLPALAFLGALRRLLASASASLRRDWNLALFAIVSLLLGASLFAVDGGVTTVWRNNYGDLAFHVGMIASFVLGGNVRPEYTVYAGELLSYPFLANLGSASAWWIAPTLPALRRIFAVEWLVLWCAVYALLDGHRNRLLPWALLFGGGSLFTLGENAGQRIEAGFPYSAFLPTVWVTQRAALLGACAALAALRFFQCALEEPEGAPGRRLGLAAAGVVLGLSPLAHLHLGAVAGLWIALVLAIHLPRSARDLAVFGLFALPTLLWLPWLVGKAGMLSLAAGWVTGDAARLAGGARLAASLGAWLRDAPVWLALVAFLWWRTRRHDLFAPLALLFAAGNLVQLAVWDWDQIKVFLGLYLVFLALWSRLPGRAARLAQAACLLLVVPGLVEAGAALRSEARVVYTAEDVERATAVRERTPASAVIACAPRHNTLATLTGRRLFVGYADTLWSHGIDSREREEMLRDLSALAACTLPTCPTHLLWTESEQASWNAETPGPGFEPTELEYLYLVKRRARAEAPAPP